MRNILMDDLNVKYPIIQGGMANIATSELASAVCLAGGLGLIGTGGWDENHARDEIIKMKELVGDLPFGVNVMLLNPHAEKIIDVCIEEKVHVITTGAGNPGKYVKKIHDANIMIFPVVPSLALALRMQKLGVDAVIAEGGESGGHVGELTTMALVPTILSELEIPVIAAGGVANNSAFAACMAMGAQGVQIGTVLLTCHECPVHENYKDLIIKARDTSTIVTGRIKGVPVRSLKNMMSKEYASLEYSDIDFESLERMTLGSLKKAVYDGNIDEGSFMAGQVSGMIKTKRSVKEVIESLVDIKQNVKILEDLNNKLNN